MSAFRVGQRVRVVRVRQPTVIRVGQEGTVNELDVVSNFGERGLIGVTLDGEPGWCFRASELEPATYDGNQLVEWSECLWQPEGQAA